MEVNNCWFDVLSNLCSAKWDTQKIDQFTKLAKFSPDELSEKEKIENSKEIYGVLDAASLPPSPKAQGKMVLQECIFPEWKDEPIDSGSLAPANGQKSDKKGQTKDNKPIQELPGPGSTEKTGKGKDDPSGKDAKGPDKTKKQPESGKKSIANSIDGQK